MTEMFYNCINLKELNELMNIPDYIRDIKDEDLDLLVKRILKESYMCGNPKLMSKKQCRNMLLKIKGIRNEE